jgi:hypothetical protein
VSPIAFRKNFTSGKLSSSLYQERLQPRTLLDESVCASARYPVFLREKTLSMYAHDNDKIISIAVTF